MLSACAFLASRRTRQYVLPLLLILSVIIVTGCRKKDYPKPSPTGPDPGEWTLVFPGPLFMYRDSVSGHVPNEKIYVRLYGRNGNLSGGKIIRLQAAVSRDSVSASVNSVVDTIGTPWGSQPAIIYWGTGGVEGHETVQGWALDGNDTVATTSLSFKVLDPN